MAKLIFNSFEEKKRCGEQDSAQEDQLQESSRWRSSTWGSSSQRIVCSSDARWWATDFWSSFWSNRQKTRYIKNYYAHVSSFRMQGHFLGDMEWEFYLPWHFYIKLRIPNFILLQLQSSSSTIGRQRPLWRLWRSNIHGKDLFSTDSFNWYIS